MLALESIFGSKHGLSNKRAFAHLLSRLTLYDVCGSMHDLNMQWTFLGSTLPLMHAR